MEFESTIVSDPIPMAQSDAPYGQYVGSVKWFQPRYGYGFVRVCTGDLKGTDVFVHHSGLKPLNSTFKCLYRGEYIHLDVVDGRNGKQAVNVTGIYGGPLMCDNVSGAPGGPFTPPAAPYGQQGQSGGSRGGFRGGRGGRGGRGISTQAPCGDDMC